MNVRFEWLTNVNNSFTGTANTSYMPSIPFALCKLYHRRHLRNTHISAPQVKVSQGKWGSNSGHTLTKHTTEGKDVGANFFLYFGFLSLFRMMDVVAFASLCCRDHRPPAPPVVFSLDDSSGG